jgi:hypothetical protein
MEMANKYLKDTIMNVVDNQLNANDPPITWETYDRLLVAGYTKQQAKEKIGTVVVSEIFDILKLNKPFDEARYEAGLKALK